MKLRLSGVVIIVLTALAGGGAWAQTVPQEQTIQSPAQAEADYRYQFDQYRSSYNNYLVTKTEYLETGGLKAEQEALSSAKVTAVARSEVLRAYNRWLTLQLLQYQLALPQVTETVAKLNQQANWYLDHKAQVQAAAAVSSFEEVMKDYVLEQKNRDKLYALAQIDLKLARLGFFQQQARLLYDPVLLRLEPQRNIPEVEQGLARIASIGEQINELILETRTKAGAIESGDLEISQGLRQTVQRLEKIQELQLTLINLMIELETRYVR